MEPVVNAGVRDWTHRSPPDTQDKSAAADEDTPGGVEIHFIHNVLVVGGRGCIALGGCGWRIYTQVRTLLVLPMQVKIRRQKAFGISAMVVDTRL